MRRKREKTQKRAESASKRERRRLEKRKQRERGGRGRRIGECDLIPLHSGGNPSTTPNVICPNAPQPTLPPATSASPLPTPPNSESMTQPLTTDPTTTNSESTTSPVTTTPTPSKRRRKKRELYTSRRGKMILIVSFLFVSALSTLPQKTTTPHPPHKRNNLVFFQETISLLLISLPSLRSQVGYPGDCDYRSCDRCDIDCDSSNLLLCIEMQKRTLRDRSERFVFESNNYCRFIITLDTHNDILFCIYLFAIYK